MKKEPKVYLSHILSAINLIQTYVEDQTYNEFLHDNLHQDGVIRELEIIGEACKNLEKHFYQTYPQIPWDIIIGTRNHLTHEYWDIDLEEIWHTAKTDVPELKSQIEGILKSLNGKEK